MLLYWQVVRRVQIEILKSRRAEYEEQVVPSLATQLALEFGQGFAEKNLRRMIQLADVFPDREIVVTLSRQLGWSHFLAILPLRFAVRVTPPHARLASGCRPSSAGRDSLTRRVATKGFCVRVTSSFLELS